MAKLVHEKTGIEVTANEVLTDFRGDTATFKSFDEPHKPSSTGRVYTQPNDEEYSNSSYPSVFGLKIIEHQFSKEA